MPTASLMTRGTMNSAPGQFDDQRAYQFALELSMLRINGKQDSLARRNYDSNSLPHHDHSETFPDYHSSDPQFNGKIQPAALDHQYEDPVGASRKSANMTETVPVPSSEHVAEIVGRQGCKIKALRAKTNTYIKTPVRGAEPVFVVTGRQEDVAQAKREIVSAAEHFSQIRASRRNGVAGGSQSHSSGSASPTSVPGHVTIQVRVPYKVVGLVVGPKGATIKRIQQTTSTYIVTPGRDKEPVFEVTGLPDSVEKAREEIEKHIASRTGTDNNSDLHIDDFQINGIDSGFHDQSSDSNSYNNYPGVLNLHDNLPPLSSLQQNGQFHHANSSGALKNISDSYNLPFTAFNTFDAADVDEGIGTSGPNIFDPAAIWSNDASYGVQRSNSISVAHRLPPNDDGPHPRTRRTNSDPLAAVFQSVDAAFSSSSPASSQGSTSPVVARRSPTPARTCFSCGGCEVTAALVPCGHNMFCMPCAKEICGRDHGECPICHTPPTQAIHIRN